MWNCKDPHSYRFKYFWGNSKLWLNNYLVTFEHCSIYLQMSFLIFCVNFSFFSSLLVLWFDFFYCNWLKREQYKQKNQLVRKWTWSVNNMFLYDLFSSWREMINLRYWFQWHKWWHGDVARGHRGHGRTFCLAAGLIFKGLYFSKRCN